jgi:predicted peptidase
MQLNSGGKMFLNPLNREKYPAFVIFPQCPKNELWAYERVPKNFDKLPYPDKMNRSMQLVKEVLDKYLQMPEVDKDRVYVMGSSMGGVGTYEIVSRYPEIFAAAVPLCGAIAPGHLGGAKDVKFRIYHGDDDTTVPVECARRVYRELRSIGAEFEYIEYPGGKHGIGSMTFTRPDFMEWIFAQRRGKRMVKIKK